MELISNYKGYDPFILNCKNKLYNNEELNEFDILYCDNNLFLDKIQINSFIDLIDNTRINKTYKRNFDKKLFVQYIIGKTSEWYHLQILLNNEIEYIFVKKSDIKNIERSYEDLSNKIYDIIKIDKIKRTPYDFQLEGIKHNSKYKKTFLLDDKGLGKTYQGILSALYNDCKKILVIGIASTKKNWASEISNFSNDFFIVNDNKKKVYDGYEKFTIINYEILQKFEDKLVYENYDCVIIDEYHECATQTSKRYKALLNILYRNDPEYIFMMSATPAQNINQYLSSIRLLYNQKFYSYINYKKQLEENYVTYDKLNKVSFLSIPKILGHNFKTLKNLSYSNNLLIKLKNETSKHYQCIVIKGGMVSIKKYIYVLCKMFFEKHIIKRPEYFYKIEILDKFKNLDIITNGKNCGLQNFNDFIQKYDFKTDVENHFNINIPINVSGRKTNDLNFFLNMKILNLNPTFVRKEEFKNRFASHVIMRRLITDEKIQKNLPNKFYEKVLINLNEEQRKEYNKLYNEYKIKKNTKDHYDIVEQGLWRQYLAINKIEHTIMLLQTFPKEDKFLIFTNYQEELELLEENLTRMGQKVMTIKGGIQSKTKEKIIKLLDNLNGLIINLQAGGTGLNIIAANRLIFNSRHFNPDKENQGEGRIYRLGQTKDCYIYRPHFNNTEEDHIQKVNDTKNEFIDYIINHNDRY